MSVRRGAFSLVELVVVVTIVATLVALVLPGVQSARESARAIACRNNLKQVSLALGIHLSTSSRFPAGGWGHEWIGMPDRGTGKRQPGGWVYSSLPYIEKSSLYHLGEGLSGGEADVAYTVRLGTPIPLYVCPTRRTCSTWPVGNSHSGSFRPIGTSKWVAKSDYAINGGVVTVASFSGPASLDEGDRETYWRGLILPATMTGVCHLRTSTSLRQIVDGTSHTYLVGEKMISPDNYESGMSTGDNDAMYTGFSNDLHRFSGNIKSSSPWVPPLPDGPENVEPLGYLRFGGPHANGVLMSYCDGSVQTVAYDVDSSVHFRAGHRGDEGAAIEDLKLTLR